MVPLLTKQVRPSYSSSCNRRDQQIESTKLPNWLYVTSCRSVTSLPANHVSLGEYQTVKADQCLCPLFCPFTHTMAATNTSSNVYCSLRRSSSMLLPKALAYLRFSFTNSVFHVHLGYRVPSSPLLTYAPPPTTVDTAPTSLYPSRTTSHLISFWVTTD